MLAVRYLLAELEGDRCTLTNPCWGWCECRSVAMGPCSAGRGMKAKLL